MVDFCTVTVGASCAGAVVAAFVEGVVAVTDSGLSVGSTGALTAGVTRPVVDDRTATDEPLLESAAGGLPVVRARAGLAVLGPRLEFWDWLELLPELLAECGAAPESDPPSVEAAATPLPTPTARPIPTAAARIPLRAARLPLPAARFR